jgi:sulfate-transporting ATPase
MTEVIQFAIVGLGLAAAYSLLASGIVLIYRGSGVVNFAHGAFALVGAIVFVELKQQGWAAIPAVLAATIAGGLIGLIMQAGIMARLRGAAPITRVIATLGVLIAIQGAAALHYAGSIVQVAPYLPVHAWHVGSVTIPSDRIFLYGIAVLASLVLWLMQVRTRTGLATLAAAENPVAVASLGWSANSLATLSWVIGCAMAGLAGALVVPLTGLLVNNLVLLVLPALAAALLGRFDSYFGALLGATAIGIGQSLIVRYVHQPGAADAFPFLVIIVVLVVMGRTLPVRSQIGERLPSIGRGLVRPIPVAVFTVVVAALMLFVFNNLWLDAFTISLGVAVILLSIVVLTGYAGQVSLAQYALAGIGAWIAGRLVATTGVPFWAAAIIGIIGAVPISALFALPALRTRGVNLAVITLGLGVAVQSLIFSNVKYTGGISGTEIGTTSLFGLDIDAIGHPERYGIFVLVAFLVAALVVANLRRSAAGRRLIAIRENERAAASLGVSVVGAKLYAFGVAAAIAALGGILLGFRSTSIVYPDYSPLQSIYAMAYAVIGGVGYIVGPLVGSAFASGGFGSLLNQLLSGIDDYLALIGGVVVVITVVLNPDGMVPGTVATYRAVAARLGGGRRSARAQREALEALEREVQPVEQVLVRTKTPDRVTPRALDVEGLSVRFGAVVAVDDVSLSVKPGEIVGLIGPNGAGKTTFIDAVTGFVRASQGSVRFDGADLVRRSASARARAGMARSWQSLELFEDVSVLENLQVASESGNRIWSQNLRALVRPGRSPLVPAAAAAVDEFDLAGDLARRPGDLSYGRRRLVGIARAVALNPSMLLLDEPAAGLNATESKELGALMRRLTESWGMGILLVEHDVDLVMSVCDRVVVLNFGKVIAAGPPDVVRRDEAVVTAYLGPEEERAASAPIATPASGPREERA